MLLSYGPMEGVTSCVYRRVHARLFPGVDRYYAPFLAPDSAGNCRQRSLRELLPEENPGLTLIPQLLCSSAGSFLAAAEKLRELGCGEVDLNAGCPSGTVVPKHKGAGLLSDPAGLDAMLDGIFSRCPMAVSVKTRLGLSRPEEFAALLAIYRRYPLSELIVHVRTRDGMYRSRADRAAICQALEGSPFPVCYNGDLFTPADLEALLAAAPGVERIMPARGAAANPALFRLLRGGAPLSEEELRGFLEALRLEFAAAGLPEQHVLARLKELWFYLICLFPGTRLGLKSLSRARSIADYRIAVEALFAEGRFDGAAGFTGTSG